MSTLESAAAHLGSAEKGLDPVAAAVMASGAEMEKAVSQFAAVGAVDRVQAAAALKDALERYAGSLAQAKKTAEQLRSQIIRLSGG